MAASDAAKQTSLGKALAALDAMGFRFRTQSVTGDEYVPAEEIVSDLRHGDMAEMLTWPANWNDSTQILSVIAPIDAPESPGVLIEFHAQRVSGIPMEHKR